MGEQKGIEIGRLEEKLKIARNMIQCGSDINFVKKATGLY